MQQFSTSNTKTIPRTPTQTPRQSLHAVIHQVKLFPIIAPARQEDFTCCTSGCQAALRSPGALPDKKPTALLTTSWLRTGAKCSLPGLFTQLSELFLDPTQAHSSLVLLRSLLDCVCQAGMCLSTPIIPLATFTAVPSFVPANRGMWPSENCPKWDMASD